MKVKYKNAEPEIVLQPNVYAMFNYIADNIKTNLIWVCLVRKVGNKYIVEDLYFPPQNVNEWLMCNFSEDYLGKVTNSTFYNDHRACRFNMIGRFTMAKSVEITDEAFKTFDKIASPFLDECLMMQLNNEMDMSFAVNRKATFLSELEWSIDMTALLDKGAFQALLDSKIGKYSYTSTVTEAKNTSNVVEMKKKDIGVKSDDMPKKSPLLLENIAWNTVV